MQKLPALQPAGAFPDSLVERIAETFPEYEQFLQALRRA
nr:unknown [Zea mays]